MSLPIAGLVVAGVCFGLISMFSHMYSNSTINEKVGFKENVLYVALQAVLFCIFMIAMAEPIIYLMKEWVL